MVRINLKHPALLSDQHLCAEHVEILMLFYVARKYERGKTNIPETFRLGKGHMNFFKDKLGYLYKRFGAIQNEMRKRGFNVKAKAPNHQIYYNDQMGDYHPTEEARQIINARIFSRIMLKPQFYSWYGKKLSPMEWYKLVYEEIRPNEKDDKKIKEGLGVE